MIKRYLVFASNLYYPSGGWDDFVASFDEWEDALEAANGLLEDKDSTEIVDTTTGTAYASFREFKEAQYKTEYYEHRNGLVKGYKGEPRTYTDPGSWRNCEYDE